MNYQINFIPEALTDIKKLDHSVRPQVVKGIQKVSQNPVSIYQGGYGKPLGNKDGSNLTGLFKVEINFSLQLNLGLKFNADKYDIDFYSRAGYTMSERG